MKHHTLRLQTAIDLFRRHTDHQTFFCYRGPFMDQLTSTILEIYEGALSDSLQPVVNRKMSFLLVECFQNILRHGELDGHPEVNDDEGLFSFKRFNHQFVINSINFLKEEESHDLRTMVDTINSLDTNELKELHLRQLAKNQISTKGGAGLGLIELARKSGRNLLYQIENFSTGLCAFHQQVTFSHESIDEVVDFIPPTKVDYQKMTNENLFLFYKGDFSQRAILPLLDIVEQNVSGGESLGSNQRKTGHVLVELLQNISKHGDAGFGAKNGVFLIGRNHESVFILAGNIVSHKEKQILESNLVNLSALNRQELKELHKTALKGSLKSEIKNKSGLGLIEIAQMSSTSLEFTFEPLNDSCYFFVLHTSI